MINCGDAYETLLILLSSRCGRGKRYVSPYRAAPHHTCDLLWSPDCKDFASEL